MTQEELELEQYRALRAEVLRAMEDGNQVMTFGLGAIGIVITAGLSMHDNGLGFFVLALIAPALSSLVLSMWFAAQERIARASYFITGIEHRLKALSKHPHMPMWDSWLRTPSKTSKFQQHFLNTEFSGIGILAFLMFGPMFLSLFVGGTLHTRTKIIIVAVLCCASILYLVWMSQRVKRWRNWLGSIFGDLD